MGGDLVGDGVGAHQLPDQLPTRAGGADSADANAVPQGLGDRPQSFPHHLDGAAVGPDIDLVQDVSPRIEHDQVGADRPDVDAKVRLHLRAGRGEARRADSIAQEQHVLQAQGPGRRAVAPVAVRTRRDGVAECEGRVDRCSRRGAPAQKGGADGPVPGGGVGDEELAFVERVQFAQGLRDAGISREPAHERHGRHDGLAFADAAFEVASYRIAQSAENLGWGGPLLLGMDHVGLGEDRTAAGDAGRRGGRQGDAADVFHAITEPVCLLVHEGAGARRAVAVGFIVQDGRLPGDGIDGETQEAGGFTPHLEDGRDLRMQERYRGCDGLEVVDALDRFVGLEEPSARPGHANALDGKVGDGIPDGAKDRLRDAYGIAEGPAIGRKEEGLAGRTGRRTPRPAPTAGGADDPRGPQRPRL